MGLYVEPTLAGKMVMQNNSKKLQDTNPLCKMFCSTLTTVQAFNARAIAFTFHKHTSAITT